jgi:hypothetical protein
MADSVLTLAAVERRHAEARADLARIEGRILIPRLGQAMETVTRAVAQLGADAEAAADAMLDHEVEAMWAGAAG